MASRAVKIASKSGCPEDNHFSKYSCPHRIFGCPHTKKECWLPGNIIKCLVYFVVPMNAVVRVATGQGKVREIQGQGKVREFWNWSGKFGILRKVREFWNWSGKFDFLMSYAQ